MTTRPPDPPDPFPAHRPAPDPLWPSAATEEGQVLRLSAGLSNPGNPRRALRLFLWLVAGIVAFAAFVVVLALL